jgi:two-component system OmpR family response regulator
VRLLLAEDDITLGEGLRDFLELEGHRVLWVKTLAHASTYAEEPFDCWLLDWNLPDGSGIELLARLRAKGSTTPAIILTARDLLADRIKGLDSGADDYLVKPFAPEELSARLRSLTRRITGGARRKILEDVDIDIEGRVVWKAGVPVELTAREWSILQALALRPGRIVSRSDIQYLIRSFDDAALASNAIEVHVSNLRAKLGKGLIETVRGLGYKIPASSGAPKA